MNYLTYLYSSLYKRKLNVFIIIIAALHLVFASVIIIGTAFFREVPITRFHEGLYFPNFLYYGIAIILIVKTVFYLKNDEFDDCKCRRAVLIAFCVGTFITIAISLWIPRLYFYDTFFMQQTAIAFPDNVDMSEYAWYFRRFPYQLNVTTIFGGIFYLTHKWGLVIICGALFVILTCLFFFKSILNITGNKMIAVLSLVVLLLMLCFNWRTYLPYTDNWGMLFPVIMFYILTTKVNRMTKILVVILMGVIGSLIKATILIPCIAILMTFLLVETDLFTLKNCCVVIAAIFLSAFFLGIIVPKGIQRINHFTPNPDEEYKMSYFFYLGQNAQYGINNVEDVEFASQFKTQKERQIACINGAFQRIANRGVFGNMKFATCKLIVATGDGLFSTPQGRIEWLGNDSKQEILEKRSSFPGAFLIKGGRYYQVYTGIEQVLWNCTLLLLLISSFFLKDKISLSLSLTFIGYLLYILIFENRAKYLFLPVPLFVMLASITLWRLNVLYQRRTSVKQHSYCSTTNKN